MKVFLTGASGFIGSHVARFLVNKGCDVLALVLPNEMLWRLADLIGKIEVVKGNLNDVASYRPALAEWQPEVCIHLAWFVEPGNYLHSPENIYALNASLTLLQTLSELKCQQFVGAGTCAEYNTDRGYLLEDDPTDPVTLYAAAKLGCYLLGKQIAAAVGMRFAWGRIFYPYGPYEDERRVVPALIRILMKNQPFPATLGEQVRDYIYVEDVATALCVLAEKQANGVFNISSGAPVTIRQLLETIGNLMGCAELIQFGAQPYRVWEPPFICGDNQRLKGLGWKAAYTLHHGLSQTVHWWETRSQDGFSA